jgi:uncharacterized Zn finger protein
MTTTTGTPSISPVQQIEALHQRLVKAREIVAAGKVHPIVGLEAHYTVEASTGGFYLVNGECTCPDAQEKADIHHGWCKHMLAVEIYKESPKEAPEQSPKPKRAKRNQPETVDASLSEEIQNKVAELYT